MTAVSTACFSCFWPVVTFHICSCSLINIFFVADARECVWISIFIIRPPSQPLCTDSFGSKLSCKFWENLTPPARGLQQNANEATATFPSPYSRPRHTSALQWTSPSDAWSQWRFRRSTLLASLPYLRCNEWGHLNRIYDIFKTWLLRIWELFIRLKHDLSCRECCFAGNKWFCCSFSNELLFIHSSNKPICMHICPHDGCN